MFRFGSFLGKKSPVLEDVVPRVIQGPLDFQGDLQAGGFFASLDLREVAAADPDEFAESRLRITIGLSEPLQFYSHAVLSFLSGGLRPITGFLF